jgi:tRNA(Ile)-lysidine synthase
MILHGCTIEVVVERLLQHVAEHQLIRAGDRVAVAVSGGADSVALFRLLLEVRGELGIVLSVTHFNHKIRGPEADADEAFVRALAAKYDVAFHVCSADTPQFGRDHHLGLEAAGRQLRYQFFRELIRRNNANKVATAHTLDDQAETVLLRLMRGAGTKGLAGIHPEIKIEGGSIVRPLLDVHRAELRAWLKSLGQSWREDATNADLSFRRNRVRHKLLPLIESEFGSASFERLAETAEIARAEENYWEAELQPLLPELTADREYRLSVDALLQQPLAIRRRLIRAAAQRLNATLDFRHVEQVLALAQSGGRRNISLPGGLHASADKGNLRLLKEQEESKVQPFAYKLSVPGEIEIAELHCRIRFRLIEGSEALASYDPRQLLSPELNGGELVIRNWRAGDRFWPLHSKSDKKIKELLKPDCVPAALRALWPLAEHQGEILWVRGLPVAHNFSARGEHSAIAVEDFPVPQTDADQG